MMMRAMAVWFVLLVIASANGALRQAVLIPAVGDVAGRAINTIMLGTLIALLTWTMIPWLRPRSNGDAWMIGGAWVALTLAFEFLAGHYLFGAPWDALLEDYNVRRGRIWILVLIVTAIAPFVSAHARGILGSDEHLIGSEAGLHRLQRPRARGPQFAADRDAAEGDSARAQHSQLRRKAVIASRQAVIAMHESGEIGDDAFHQVEEELDWLENGRRSENRERDSLKGRGCS